MLMRTQLPLKALCKIIHQERMRCALVFFVLVVIYYLLSIHILSKERKTAQQIEEELKKLQKSYGKNRHGYKSRLRICDIECQKLNDLFKYEWPKTKPKAVIYYLLKTTDIPNIQKAIQLMDKNFNMKHNYPYIIFHEEDFLPNGNEVRSFAHNPDYVFFQQVDFSQLPDHINLDTYRKARFEGFCREYQIGK